MKYKKTDPVVFLMFCGFLFFMLILYVIVPGKDFSEKEKRYLASVPELTWETLLSGQYGNDVETYLADHIPGRDLFVGVNAYFDRLTGRQVAKDIYTGSGDILVEAPIVRNQKQAEKNTGAVQRFADLVGQPVDLMLVPSGGFIQEAKLHGLHDPYVDDELIADLYGMMGDNVSCIDLIPTFTEYTGEALYYRTDHHWTSAGAYLAYGHYMEQLGKDYPAADAFTVEQYDGFYGSNYARSGLWLCPPEPVELWETDTAFTVENNDTEEVHDGLFYEERLEELDKYTVYLDGNHSLVRIHNPDAVGKGSLLVIRDSYANCLGTFLAHSYETVVLVDLRYYKYPVSELMAEEHFDNVLVCYSLGNFMTDNNLIFLR